MTASEPTNAERAGWAEHALETFAQDTWGAVSPTKMDSVECGLLVSDLLADLMHYCQGTGIDYEAALERARDHYEYEKGLE